MMTSELLINNQEEMPDVENVDNPKIKKKMWKRNVMY